MRPRRACSPAQVVPIRHGVPCLGFVVYPQRLRVKARKVRYATRRLGALYAALCDGAISFAEFDACVQGWINHVTPGDESGGLRAHVLEPFVWPAGSRRGARRRK